MRPSPLAVVVACVAWVTGACARHQADALRPQLMARKASSVAEWAGGEAVLREATARVGVLLPDGADAVGFAVQVLREGEPPVETFEFANLGGGRGRTKISAAVPVTEDGYFLTARHCLGDGVPAVFLRAPGGRRLEKSPARVVWISGEEADLALLHTGHRPAEPFAIGTPAALAAGDRLGASGWSGLGGGGGLFDGIAAGRVRSVTREGGGDGDGPVWWRVVHDAPIQPGDSGGPLLDREGRLVGIHSGGRVGALAIYERKPEGAPLRGFEAMSHLPEPGWLARVIADDRSRAGGRYSVSNSR